MLSLSEMRDKINLNFQEILYILSLCICFQTTLPYFGELNYFIRYFITFGWVCYFAYILYKDRSMFKMDMLKDYIVLFIPSLFIFVYSVFLLIIGQMEFSYVGRFVSSFVSVVAPFMMLYIGHSLFEKRIFKIGLIAFFSSFILLLIANILYYGIGDTIFQWINSVFIDNSTAKNHFEVHDMTFASAELLVFALLYFKKGNIDKKQMMIIGSIFAIFLLGFKRIAILAFVAIIALMIFNKILLKNRNKQFIKNYFIFILSSFIVLLFVFVWSIDSGFLTYLTQTFHINTMDRIHFYEWLAEYFDFSVFFLGKGFGASSKMMHLYNSWGIAFNIGSIHSEVLKLFFELGFIGFLGILIYYFFAVPKYLDDKHNGSAKVYIYLQLLLFLFHLTDNTYTYYMTQFYYAIIFIWLCNFTQSIEVGDHDETSIDNRTSL